jgi:hypothetical protein
MQQVINKTRPNQKAKEKLAKLLKGMLYLTSDVVTKKVIDKEMDEIVEYFGLTVEGIRTFSQTLDDVIGDGKLIVFIDDFDRCSADNIIDMLEAIKLLFCANKANFVVGVDLGKLERAWVLKHGRQLDALNEGREHLDKIFQLKLALPPKDDAMVRRYIESVTKALPEEITNFLVRAVPYNPRKIKRALNLAHFILNGVEESNFGRIFPYVLIWSILNTAFPEIVKEVRRDPQILIHLCAFATLTDHATFQRKVVEGKHTDSTSNGGRQRNIYDHLGAGHAHHPVAATLIENELVKDGNLYRFLLNVRDALGIMDDPTKNKDKTETLRRTISYAGLLS